MLVMEIQDLSTIHQLVSDIFKWPTNKKDWEQYELSQEQIDFFNVNGFIGGIKMIDDEQVERLRDELNELIDPASAGHDLFYEFHSNESADADTILFHALGAWRITPAYHDVLWNPRFVVAASQLLGNVPVRF